MTALLPNGEQQFCDAAGVSLALGTVGFYVPGTLSPKATWKDAGQVTMNANPVPLDGGGYAVIFGSGDYRQIVKDVNGNVIWDQLTSAPLVSADTASIVATAVATIRAEIGNAALYASDYGVVGQNAGDTPIDQTAVCQAAEDAAMAAAFALGSTVDLHWPGGFNYGLNNTPRPLVRNILHNTIFKTLANASTYGDYRRRWRIEYNDVAWIDVPLANRNDGFHFGFDGDGAIDGNWLYASQWTGSVEYWETTNQGSGYTSLPTLTVSGGLGTGMTATPLMGAATVTVNTGAATGYAVGDEVIFGAGAGTLFNSTAFRLRILAVTAGVPTSWEVVEAGAWSILATGNLAQSSVVSYANNSLILAGRSGLTVTVNTWKLVDVQNGARGTDYFVASFPEFGGNLALSITGGGGAGATAVPHWIGDYYRNGVFGTGTNEHNAGLWLRCPQGLSYRPKFYVGSGVQIQNTQGDAFYVGSPWDVDFRGSTNNHFRGGLTVVSGCRYRAEGASVTGYGLGIDIELSGGYWNDTSKLRATNGPAITAAGSGYVVGDALYVPTGLYDQPWSMVVAAVDGSGGITSFIPTSEGRYHATPTSLTGIAMKGGTGSGCQMTHVVGSSAIDIEITDVLCDTQRGCNIFPFLGRVKITGYIAGARHLVLQSGGGAGDLQLEVDWVCRDAALSFSTILPSLVRMSGSVAHSPRNTGAVQNSYNVSSDRQTAIMLSNSSGGTCTPEAIINFDNLVINKIRGNRNSPSYGLLGSGIQYTGAGYSYTTSLGSITFNGDYYTQRIYQRSGRWLYDGPINLGRAAGGGIQIISDQSVIPNSYGCAAEIPHAVVRGNANPALTLSQIGSNVDARYYVSLGGVWRVEDILLGSTVSGTVLAVHSGRKIKGAAAPTGGGLVGDTYELDVPVVGQPSGWLCTVSNPTAATWIAKANL